MVGLGYIVVNLTLITIFIKGHSAHSGILELD
jgi:hypothetical protein